MKSTLSLTEGHLKLFSEITLAPMKKSPKVNDV